MKSGLHRFVVGFLVSIGLHVVLLACAYLLLSSTVARPGDFDAEESAPALDVSSVDLSFPEDTFDKAASSAASPVPAPTGRFQPPQPVSRMLEQEPLKSFGEMPEAAVPRVVDVRATALRPRELDAPEAPRDDPSEGGRMVALPTLAPSALTVPSTSAPLAVDRPASVHVADAEVEATPPVAVSPVGASTAGMPSVSAPFQSDPARSAERAAWNDGQVIEPPSLRGRIKKNYPISSRKRKEEGDVTLDLSVDAHGVVIGVKIVASCGFKDLENAALAAARKVLFRPAKQGDKAVPSVTRLTWSFKLRDKD